MKRLAGPRVLIIFWSVILSLAAILIVGYLVLASVYDGRVYPNIKLGDTKLSGQDEAGLAIKVSDRAKQVMESDWLFSYNNDKLTIDPQLGQTANIDSARPLIDMNVEKTAAQAWNVGRQGNFAIDWFNSWRSLIFSKKIVWQYDLDETRLKETLREKFGDQEKPLQNAGLNITINPNGSLDVKTIPEQTGREIDYAAAISQLKKQIESGEYSEIVLAVKDAWPEIKLAGAPAADNISGLLDLPALEIKDLNPASSSPVVIKADKADFAKWINYIQDSGRVKIGFDPARIEAWLTEKAVPLIDREPNPAKFEMKGARVQSFQTSADGRQIDLSASAKKIIAALDNKQTSVDLEIKIVADDSVQPDSLGIEQIIGTGQSNFAGSPKNRRHNIAVGAAAVSGLLVKPGEEFSLVKALGEVDKESGYLPELVIKENRTVPEYGGGLCQVGTTLFRAAIESGLPITARRNHSYRVTYYEPAGMDAAIYIPQPDVRFINDTENYILIQSRIVGDDIYFDFWGVKDGRQINISKPVVYNIVKPAATKFIPSPDLKPGEKKCTERAHNGADAYFDYKVVYNPGTDKEEIKENRFSSHYVPWQEVCLVGQVASSTATSTPAVSSSSSSTVSTTTN
ncbi:MAG TPA: VanW family protein [bacterium]|nr:VanW family protein [bacterium]HPT29397.1 VanW family protein [bacterium]